MPATPGRGDSQPPALPDRPPPQAAESFEWTRFARKRNRFGLDLAAIWRVASWLIAGVVPILTGLVLLRALNQPPQQVVVHEPGPAPEVRQRDLGEAIRRPNRDAPLGRSGRSTDGAPRNPAPLPGAHDPQEGEVAGPPDPRSPTESGKEHVEPTDPVGPIELPNGRQVSLERLDKPRGEVDALVARARARIDGDEWFAPYLEVLENNQWALCHGYDVKNGRLRGPGMIWYSNGQPMLLAEYENGQLHGALRIWDEDGALVLYAEYTRGKHNGLVCLFKHNVPWLVIDGKLGGSADEFVIVRIGSVLTVFDLARPDLPHEAGREERAARADLAALDEMLEEMHTKLRPAVREWFEQERQEFQRPLVIGRARAIRTAKTERRKATAQANNAAYARVVGAIVRSMLP